MDTFWGIAGTVLALLAIGAGIAVAEASTGEFWMARALFALSATIVAGYAMWWLVTTDWSFSQRSTVALILGIIVFVGFSQLFRWVDGKQAKALAKQNAILPTSEQPNPVIPERLLDTQITELIALRDFLGEKDSADQLFDIPNIVLFNIRMIRRQITPKLVKPDESKAIDDFFKGGQAVSDVRYFKNVNGVAVLEAPPNVIWCINTSATYARNRQTLTRYQNSVLLPSSVRNAVKDLADTLDANTGILRDVLTEKYSGKREDIIDAENYGSPSYGVTNGQFLMRATPLQPKEDSIVVAIRSYLDIK